MENQTVPNELKPHKSDKITKGVAAVTMVVILAVLLVGMIVFKLDLHILLIIDTVILCLVALMFGHTYDELMDFIKDTIAQCVPVMMIFLLIGCITAAWIMSGTVPGIIYYGLKFISPQAFLPLGLVLCTLTSLAIGTAWGTVSTVGIALIGMGKGLGIPAELTAGMVICGAFFGDKMSPISDTAALASTSSGSDLYKHIKSMFITSGPSFIITLVIFFFIGLRYSQGNIDNATLQGILTTIENNYKLNPLILLLPMIALFSLNLLKVPAVPSMLVGILVGCVIGIFYQGQGINATFDALNYGVVSNTGHELMDSLLARGGIQSMMWTFSLAFIALALGGILDKVGFLRALLSDAIDKVQSIGVLSIIVIATTFLGTIAMGEVYLSLVLSGSLFREAFIKKGYKPELLSRYIEEGGTMMQVFIPWSTSGSFISATLGISTLAYSPYVFMNWINPLLSIALSFLGIGIFKKRMKRTKKVELPEG